jgi:hypothetical protein
MTRASPAGGCRPVVSRHHGLGTRRQRSDQVVVPERAVRGRAGWFGLGCLAPWHEDVPAGKPPTPQYATVSHVPHVGLAREDARDLQKHGVVKCPRQDSTCDIGRACYAGP